MEKYAEKLNEGEEYQDYLIRKLYLEGIIIVPFSSMKYQNDIGESLTRHEIKYDKKMKNTGNLYIETHEKRYKNNETWVNSGILRNDNSIFYIIGDMDECYLFLKNTLKCLYNNDTYMKVETGTSRGFLLPVDKISSISEHFKFKKLKNEETE